MTIFRIPFLILSGLILTVLYVQDAGILSASSQGWRTLVDGQSLEGWQAQDPSKPHEWHTAKAVHLAGKENRFFAAEPGKGIFVNGKTGRTQNLVTLEKFGDVDVHVEFKVSYKSNSGVFLMGLYEVQVQDDYGRPDMHFSMSGGFYARKINDEWIGGHPSPHERLQAPGGVAGLRHQVPRAPLRCQREEDRERQVPGSQVQRARCPRKRRDGRPQQRPHAHPGGPQGPLDAPGRPWTGGLPQRAHPPPAVTFRLRWDLQTTARFFRPEEERPG